MRSKEAKASTYLPNYDPSYDAVTIQQEHKLSFKEIHSKLPLPTRHDVDIFVYNLHEKDAFQKTLELQQSLNNGMCFLVGNAPGAEYKEISPSHCVGDMKNKELATKCLQLIIAEIRVNYDNEIEMGDEPEFQDLMFDDPEELDTA